MRATRPRKRFGQHFLTRRDIARRIVGLAQLDGETAVLEIGPGRGALTHLLAPAASHLFLVEIDRDLTARLREQFAGQPTVHIVEGDVLRVDLPGLLGHAAPVTVVANLPYNISTAVLMRLMDTPELFRRLVIMLQREVAARLSATPGTKSYGALSVAVQLAASARVAFSVPPTAFSPRPEVESAVVVVEPKLPNPLTDQEQQAVRHLVRTAFSQRRKQLHNVISPLTARPQEILGILGIDPRRRPGTLAPAEFLRLARALESEAPG